MKSNNNISEIGKNMSDIFDYIKQRYKVDPNESIKSIIEDNLHLSMNQKLVFDLAFHLGLLYSLRKVSLDCVKVVEGIAS